MMDQTTINLAELALLHFQKLVTSGLLTSGDQGNPQAPNIPTIDIITRPWIEPPEGSIPFDQQDGIILPALAGDTVVATLVVPDGYDGVINSINCNYTGGGFVQFSGDIVWKIFRNGASVRNFDSIRNEKGSIVDPRRISPIRVYSGQVILFTVNHVANGALAGNVVCGFGGWFYPSKG